MPNFIGGKKDNASVTKHRRTLSIIDKNGKPIAVNAKNALSPNPFPKSEYSSHFNKFENLISKRIAER